jgi:hypothetical protein
MPMEHHVYAAKSFLPVEFQEQEINDFVDYLVSAYLENLPSAKYQFSFTAFHMLYMSYIYKVKWFLKMQGNSNIEDALQEFIKQNRGTSFNTVFDLSQISEKTSLDRLLKTLNFHANDVDTCKNLVEVRNKCSHASGKIYFKRPQQIENYIQEELDSMDAIQKKINPYLSNILETYIDSTWSLNWVSSEIQDWIIANYFSQRDIIFILQLNLPFLSAKSDTQEVVYKKILYITFVSEAVKHLPDKSDYFLNALKFLMAGMVKEIDIRRDPTDAERLKSTQELIEEKIVPILINLTEEEAADAQDILKLNAT